MFLFSSKGEKKEPSKNQILCLGVLGDYVAAGCAAGRLTLYDKGGTEIARWTLFYCFAVFFFSQRALFSAPSFLADLGHQ